MTTLTGHLSLYATQSLKAIDNWMNVAQGNIGGSVVTAFKEVELTYGGNLTHELRPVSQTRNGVMIAEQTLTTGNTKVNWRQGEIINTTQETHFAINGDGFFMVQDPGTLNPAAALDVTYFPATGTTAGGAGQVYLTRDGDFHWGTINGSNTLVLLDKNGMLVLSDHGDLNQVLGTVTQSGFNQPLAAPPALTRIRPSIVRPSVLNDQLQFSKYGSTYYEFGEGVPVTGTVIVDGSSGQLSNTASDTFLIEQALEASNVRIERNITELAAMGKIYNGFVQLIKVYNSNLDEVLGFIR